MEPPSGLFASPEARGNLPPCSLSMFSPQLKAPHTLLLLTPKLTVDFGSTARSDLPSLSSRASLPQSCHTKQLSFSQRASFSSLKLVFFWNILLDGFCLWNDGSTSLASQFGPPPAPSSPGREAPDLLSGWSFLSTLPSPTAEVFSPVLQLTVPVWLHCQTESIRRQVLCLICSFSHHIMV